MFVKPVRMTRVRMVQHLLNLNGVDYEPGSIATLPQCQAGRLIRTRQATALIPSEGTEAVKASEAEGIPLGPHKARHNLPVADHGDKCRCHLCRSNAEMLARFVNLDKLPKSEFLRAFPQFANDGFVQN